MKYYSVIKKNEIMSFTATWMDLEMIILSEVRKRQMLCDINYMWNLKKKDTNKLFLRNRPTVFKNKLMITKKELERSWGEG